MPGWVAALTPLSVDGMIVAASTTLLAGGDTTVVSHSHTVPAVPAGLGCPVAAGAADVGEDAADGEPDPQAAASKDSAAARMTPARAPGLIRPCPQLMDDPQVPFADPLPAPQWALVDVVAAGASLIS